MLMKRNVLLRDAETNQWLNKDLEIYPVYSNEGTLYSGNIQQLEVTHTTFKSKTNAFIAYLKGGSTEEFSGLKLAIRMDNTHYVMANVKTMGDNSLFDLLTSSWKGKIHTIDVYGQTRPDFKKLLENKKFESYLIEKMEGLHQHLKAVKVSFSKEHPIPSNWKGETYENKLLDFPQAMQVNLADVDYNYVN